MGCYSWSKHAIEMNTKVLRPFKFLSLLWLVVYAAARLSGHEGSHSYSLPIENIGKVEPDMAINLYARLSGYHPEAKEHFRNALLQRGDIEDFIRGRLEELPQTPLNGRDRNIYFRIMSDLRTPWAARICGQHLLSDYKVELPEFKTEKEAQDFFIEAGATTMANSSYAMLALEQMNIDTAPTKFGMSTPSGKKSKRDLWRVWWRNNEANIEDLLARGDTIPISNPPDDGLKPDHKTTTERQVQKPGSVSVDSPESPDGHAWWWYGIGGAALLGLGAWFMRKKTTG
jgi:hypothetical protein